MEGDRIPERLWGKVLEMHQREDEILQKVEAELVVIAKGYIMQTNVNATTRAGVVQIKDWMDDLHSLSKEA